MAQAAMRHTRSIRPAPRKSPRVNVTRAVWSGDLARKRSKRELGPMTFSRIGVVAKPKGEVMKLRLVHDLER